MIIIDNVLISEDILNCCFCCDLNICKGICCIEGDAGAPLEEEEVGILEDNLDEIFPYMTEEGKNVVNQHGSFDYDMDGNLVTPLINDGLCAFGFIENGIAKCAIEKAWTEQKIKFQKPISCHLYPIRIEKYDYYEALHYHRWNICKEAVKNGNMQKISIFNYLKEPLSRKYGKEWIKKVEIFLQTRQL